ncbi:MAG TPA: rRNA (cytidine-2'-O-)-methyltransferase, partial [Nevskiaceae bacterium]|nr:rRNA (cytidine-2'-O-)-methyltransferase [Nevskiaceae bacterium]
EPRTLIFYEASHRIRECVAAIAEAFGRERRLCLARELTKLYEESITAGAADILQWLDADVHRTKGEFVLVCAGAPAQDPSAAQAERLLNILLAELPGSQAARLAAQISGRRKNELYELALRLVQGADRQS